MACRLGLALHCLGNARQKQGLIPHSLAAYRKALANFEAILGHESFRVAQIKLKLGEILGAQDGHAQFAK